MYASQRPKSDKIGILVFVVFLMIIVNYKNITLTEVTVVVQDDNFSLRPSASLCVSAVPWNDPAEKERRRESPQISDSHH